MPANATWSQVHVLRLGSNQFTDIPEDLYEMRSMVILDAFRNKWVGLVSGCWARGSARGRVCALEVGAYVHECARVCLSALECVQMTDSAMGEQGCSCWPPSISGTLHPLRSPSSSTAAPSSLNHEPATPSYPLLPRSISGTLNPDISNLELLTNIYLTDNKLQ